MKRAVILILIGFLVSCASNPFYDDLIPVLGKPLPILVRIDGLVPIKQDYNGCVPASLSMLFRYYGKDISKEFVGDWLQKARGTDLRDIEPFVRSQGFITYEFYDSRKDKAYIKTFLAQKFPVLVAGQVRQKDENHSFVLIGYDQNRGCFAALDTSRGAIVDLGYKWFNEYHSAEDSYIKFYGLVMKPKN